MAFGVERRSFVSIPIGKLWRRVDPEEYADGCRQYITVVILAVSELETSQPNWIRPSRFAVGWTSTSHTNATGVGGLFPFGLGQVRYHQCDIASTTRYWSFRCQVQKAGEPTGRSGRSRREGLCTLACARERSNTVARWTRPRFSILTSRNRLFQARNPSGSGRFADQEFPLLDLDCWKRSKRELLRRTRRFLRPQLGFGGRSTRSTSRRRSGSE